MPEQEQLSSTRQLGNDDSIDHLQSLIFGDQDCFRQMIDALPVAIYITDAQGRLTHFNPACAEFSGRTPTLGSDSWCVVGKLYHPDGTPMPPDQCPMALALKEGRQVKGAEVIGERPDGSRIWFIAYPTIFRDGNGTITGGMNMLVDITQRKRAEDAVRAGEQQLQLATDLAEVGFWDVDHVHNTLVWPPRVKAMFGISPDAPVSMVDFYAGLHPEDRQRITAALADAVDPAKRAVYDVEYRTIGKEDGVVRWVAARGRGIFDKHDQCVRVIGTAVEITPRKRADQDSARLAAIVGSSDDAIIAKDLNGIIQSWNIAAERMFGYTAAEAIGKSITLIIPDERLSEETQILQKLRNGQRIEHFETVRRSKDGSLIELSLTISPVRDASGQIIGASKIARDITSRKRTEQEMRNALADSQLLHRLAIDMAAPGEPQALYERVMDAAVEIMHSDYASMQMFFPERGEHGELLLLAQRGFNPEGVKYWKWVALHTGSTCGEAFRTRRRCHVPDVAQCEFMRGDDLAGYLNMGMHSAQTTPLISRAGDLIGMISTHWKKPHQPSERDFRMFNALAHHAADLIERANAQQALDQARQSAENANRAKDKFLAVLSHELRTPLTPVMMSVAAMDMNPDLPPTMRQDISMIRRNIELEVKLIDDLLDLSRVTSGKLRLNLQATDWNQTVRDACETCRGQIQKKGINLHLDLCDRQATVNADAARLQQIFWNLLRNASKFTPARGDIFVSTSCENEQTARLEVRDTGIGIPPEMLVKIFDAFEQGQTSITSQFGGMGLGLSISKALVELHGGTISAGSDGAGHGASFIVEFPRVENAPTVLPGTEGPVTHDGDGIIHVLLVDDHDDTARMLARLLKKSGYSVQTAGSVADALQLASEQVFDVLISDIGLPDATGYDLMNQISKRYPIKGIAMSGFGMEDDLRRSHDAGFSDHIVKPATATQVERAIRRVVPPI